MMVCETRAAGSCHAASALSVSPDVQASHPAIPLAGPHAPESSPQVHPPTPHLPEVGRLAVAELVCALATPCTHNARRSHSCSVHSLRHRLWRRLAAIKWYCACNNAAAPPGPQCMQLNSTHRCTSDSSGSPPPRTHCPAQPGGAAGGAKGGAAGPGAKSERERQAALQTRQLNTCIEPGVGTQPLTTKPR